MDRLLAAKRASASSVSVCIPARNEAPTIAHVVGAVQELIDAGLVDECIVMNDSSTDNTSALALDAGATVVSVASVLPQCGPGSGKGEVLWKSLWASKGDIICWVDADISNFGAEFVEGLVAPLLLDPACAFVKGHYRRPVREDPIGGGRVTELVARPLISRFFPELARFFQPLSGEYCGRRTVLEAIPFVQGWGVDLGMLIDVERLVGREAMATADLGTRIHRRQSLRELGAQAMAVQSVALRRAGVIPSGPDASDAEVLLRPSLSSPGEIEAVDIEIRERPPMSSISGYGTR